VEEKKIKSALEIAMEKAAAMPGLTQEERAEQKEREYQPRGAAIGHRYLEGALKESDLQAELSRYRGQEGEIVKQAFLLTLNQSIKLESQDMSLRALAGIKAVAPSVDLGEIKRQIEAVFDEFTQRLEREIRRYQALEKERLQQLGIFGSAVKPNMADNQTWQEESERIQSEYNSRINEIKEKLSLNYRQGVSK
jgi:hypothetical protein